MKTWDEIRQQAETGDWERVAQIAKCKRNLVEKVSRGERNDNLNLQKIFSAILEHREKLSNKYGREAITA